MKPSEERRPGAGVPRFIETPKGYKSARNCSADEIRASIQSMNEEIERLREHRDGLKELLLEREPLTEDRERVEVLLVEQEANR